MQGNAGLKAFFILNRVFSKVAVLNGTRCKIL
jgi:hypothetical protein